MTLTKAKAEELKAIINQDANLSGKNLRIEGLPTWAEFKDDHPEKPPHFVGSASWMEFEDKVWQEYVEMVNQKLLPESVTHACVVGGFAIAMINAGLPLELSEMVEISRHHGGLRTSIYFHNLPGDTQKKMQEFTGLSFREFSMLQNINDSVTTIQDSWYNPETGIYEPCPWNGDEEKATVERRKRLINYVEDITEE